MTAPAGQEVTITGFLMINGAQVPFTGTFLMPAAQIVFSVDSTVTVDAGVKP